MPYPTKKLEEILDYEQPGKYIVNSKNYSSEYKTPVLTAGKTFILGNTNEKGNIFPAEKLPVIIFDDFTTAIKFVDFPFKVKSSAMKILHAKKSEADIKYLFYLMQTIKINHTTHKRYWISEYSKIEIPFPPLSEQKKIVAKLKKVLAKISEAKKLRAEAQENTKNLLSSELHKIFEEGRKKGWEKKELGEILKLCDSGTWGDESPGGMPLLRSTNMQNGELVLDDVKYIDVPKEKIERYILREGDILMTKSSGSVDHIGKSLFITKEMEGKYGFSNFTQRLRINQKLALPKWIYFKISDPSTRNFLLGASQTTTGLRNLKIPALKELEILIPPLAEQKKTVARLDKLSQKIEKIKKLQAATQNEFTILEQSILSKAFKGQL
ncbi:MAG: restriction endonuclease subunit S [Candidatus Omnitrophica bacterium]|nr:restriction endonuclease subunit S [Candidatus Omnitrophota bacterium]